MTQKWCSCYVCTTYHHADTRGIGYSMVLSRRRTIKMCALTKITCARPKKESETLLHGSVSCLWKNLAGWHPAFCPCFIASLFYSVNQHTVYSTKAGSLFLCCMIRPTSWMSFLISQTVVWNKTISSLNISPLKNPVCFVEIIEWSCLHTHSVQGLVSALLLCL